ncbi:sugar ABC transporter ATP-binding protein [Siculibacillus lacustris]|uniref:Sugar ABC transporter ATP-binding protein n=1 Tax=Siculibacillus lacustris TaxID=1549641 RepID=A0A4Q9VT67_9HYPH|nr:sugar ABC transporter ATP-binding protein [Siculibacillus lacustris]TBW38749.1 sugar ABC transporter ATP-binding protein [Siculibacillus lacustris]
MDVPARPRVVMRGITKTFPGVKALDGVDFTLAPGEIHALLGENGAGKSTLVKVLTGVLAADAGTVELDGVPIRVASPAAAQDLGINTVYQEVNLVPTLSVAENLMLERQSSRFGLISWRKTRERAEAALARLKIHVDVGRSLGSCSLAIQQLVAIARALDRDTRVLVLDEPTASLDAHEVEGLFTVLRDIRARGIAIVFITHFIDQVYAIADRITVLRNGRFAGTGTIAEVPRMRLVTLMLGKQIESHYAERPTTESIDQTGAPVIAATGLGRARWLEPIDLSVRAGEVVGLAGLLGSGRTETAKLLFGAERADKGSLVIDGVPVTLRSPGQAIRMGFGFCPEDRKHEGLILDLSVRENLILALQCRRGWWNRVGQAEQNRIAAEMIAALGIATPDAEKPVGQLSGGNQQKVILARWLAAKPRLLILDEPTRGIDIGAHAEIVGLIRRLCREGLALIVASSELEEIVAFSHRVAVLRDRRKVSEIVGADITQSTIVEAIANS